MTTARIPALFFIYLSNLDEKVQLEGSEVYPAKGNVLDVAVLEDHNVVVYSMDCVYEPFSTTLLTTDTNRFAKPCIDALQYDHLTLRLIQSAQSNSNFISVMESCAKCQIVVEPKNVAKGKSLRDLLYGLESLRKRRLDDMDE